MFFWGTPCIYNIYIQSSRLTLSKMQEYQEITREYLTLNPWQGQTTFHTLGNVNNKWSGNFSYTMTSCLFYRIQLHCSIWSIIVNLILEAFLRKIFHEWKTALKSCWLHFLCNIVEFSEFLSVLFSRWNTTKHKWHFYTKSIQSILVEIHKEKTYFL